MVNSASHQTTAPGKTPTEGSYANDSLAVQSRTCWLQNQMAKSATHPNPLVTTISLYNPLLRGEKRPRVALVGRFGVGKSSLFNDASSPIVRHEKLAGLGGAYQECVVDVGLEQITLVDLPSIETLHHLSEHDQVVLMYLLWGDRWPLAAEPTAEGKASDFPAPDVLIHVVDATTLEADLELTLELSLLG